MPVMRWRVVCALREVMLIFWPTSALSKVDLPTFGLPTMAIAPQRWPGVAAATPVTPAAVSIASRSWGAKALVAASPSATFLVAPFINFWLSMWPAWPPPPPARRPGASRRCRARSGPEREYRTRLRRSDNAPPRPLPPPGTGAVSFCGSRATPAMRFLRPWPPPASGGWYPPPGTGAAPAPPRVLGRFLLAAREPLLQCGFGVPGRRLHPGADIHILEQALHQRLGAGVTGIQVHGADQRFQRIGQDRWVLQAAGSGLVRLQFISAPAP